jgi:Xaa-Pro aminopeptidase
MSDDPFRRRTADCRDALAAADAEAAVLFPSPNLTYLTGFREEPAERHLLLFVGREDVRMVVPGLYADQVDAEVWIPEQKRIVWADDEDPTEAVHEAVADLGIGEGRVLVDDRMWALFTHDLRAAMPGADFGLASEVLRDLRIRKDESELAAMREAAAIADDVSEEVRAMGDAAVGMTERELATEVRERMEARGGVGSSFDVIVGSGENGALPHHRHGDRTIRSGDPVVLDFGTRVDGYPSDQTRTAVFSGEPPEGFHDAFAAVRAAQDAGVEAAGPGVEAQAVDRAARSVLEERGYGEQFVHRTGHGVGLEVHEPPWIVEGNRRELEPGMVFSVEPGVYFPGEYGVRIEDLVVVTDEGVERLNGSDYGWEPL